MYLFSFKVTKEDLDIARRDIIKLFKIGESLQ